MFYDNTCQNRDTAWRRICRYDPFIHVIHLKTSTSKRTFPCSSAASGTVHEDVRTYVLFFCQRHKFAMKALLLNTQYFYVADSEV